MKLKSALLGVATLLAGVSTAAAVDRTETIRFERGAAFKTLAGTIRGYDGVKYQLGAAAGQVMSVLFKPRNNACYMNVVAPGSQAAIHIGSTAGNEYAGNLQASGNYTIQVYMMRSAARRNETCKYSMTVEITGAARAAAPAGGDVVVPGTNFSATGSIPCARAAGQPMANCRFGVAAIVTAAGGAVVGDAKHAIGATDYSSQLLQAQASGADVVAFASVGGDLVNLIKQAHEFGVGVDGKQRLGGFLIYISDINAVGLATAQGFNLTTGFYWDQSPESRAFAKRFMAQTGMMPGKDHAAVYTSVLHYLQAAKQAGTVDAVAVNRAMRAAPVDYFGHAATLRADGRLMDEVTLYRVKMPAESKGPWDYYAAVQTIPASQAFLPINPDCKQ